MTDRAEPPPARALRATLRIEDVPPAGTGLRVEADEAARATLATALDLLAVERLFARIQATPEGPRGTLRLTGAVEFRVVHRCVVTLEPVAQEASEPVDVAYVSDRAVPRSGGREEAQTAERGATVEVGEVDPPEVAPGGVVDVGALVEEHLALALDPYPRAPGASFVEPAPAGDDERPFAGLAALKGRLGDA